MRFSDVNERAISHWTASQLASLRWTLWPFSRPLFLSLILIWRAYFLTFCKSLSDFEKCARNSMNAKGKYRQLIITRNHKKMFLTRHGVGTEGRSGLNRRRNGLNGGTWCKHKFYYNQFRRFSWKGGETHKDSINCYYSNWSWKAFLSLIDSI